MTLDRYTWDQATILGMATARGMRAIGIPAGTVRSWASRGQIKPIGMAPGGAKLYSVDEAARLADPLSSKND